METHMETHMDVAVQHSTVVLSAWFNAETNSLFLFSSVVCVGNKASTRFQGQHHCFIVWVWTHWRNVSIHSLYLCKAHPSRRSEVPFFFFFFTNKTRYYHFTMNCITVFVNWMIKTPQLADCVSDAWKKKRSHFSQYSQPQINTTLTHWEVLKEFCLCDIIFFSLQVSCSVDVWIWCCCFALRKTCWHWLNEYR